MTFGWWRGDVMLSPPSLARPAEMCHGLTTDASFVAAAAMAASAPFALRHLLSLLPLRHADTKTRSPPPRAPLLPLCPPSSPPPSPLSFRPRQTPQSTKGATTTTLPTPVSFLLPTHAEASEEEKGGAFGWIGAPSPPAAVLFACHPAAALANVFYAKSGYYNTQVVVAEDEPEDRLVERFRRASSRVGVFRECRRRRFFEDKQAEIKRRSREATVRRAREAARLRRIAGVAQSTGSFNPPFPQRGRKKKKKKKKRTQLRETPVREEEEEDNWELPDGEIPYCR